MNLKRFEELNKTKNYYERKIEDIKKDVHRSKMKLYRSIRRLRHEHHDYVNKLKKQIVDLQTQMKKLD